MTPILPTVALPTGAFDCAEAISDTDTVSTRYSGDDVRWIEAALRAAMAELRVTQAVVHGNIFDHAALHRLTYFTPKLGPAYALVPAEGPLRILFSGGPGMKPSAEKLTWVEHVNALRDIEADIRRWLEETGGSVGVRLGLVEGSSMMLGDWRAVERAAGREAVELDDAFARHIGAPSAHEQWARKTAEDLADEAIRLMSFSPVHDLEEQAIRVEGQLMALDETRSYCAEEIRWRLARRPNEGPTRLTGAPLYPKGDTPIVVAVRFRGQWAERRHVLKQVPVLRGYA